MTASINLSTADVAYRTGESFEGLGREVPRDCQRRRYRSMKSLGRQRNASTQRARMHGFHVHVTLDYGIALCVSNAASMSEV